MPKKASSEPPAVARYRRIFAEHAKGVSLKALAKRHGVKRKTLVWWRWEVGRRDGLKRKKTKAAGAKRSPRKKTRAAGAKRSPRKRTREPRSAPLLPVRVVQPSVHTAMSAGFEVLLRSGVVVRVPAGFDGGDLRRLVTTLETPGC